VCEFAAVCAAFQVHPDLLGSLGRSWAVSVAFETWAYTVEKSRYYGLLWSKFKITFCSLGSVFCKPRLQKQGALSKWHCRHLTTLYFIFRRRWISLVQVDPLLFYTVPKVQTFNPCSRRELMRVLKVYGQVDQQGGI
jgi:hypothetical protein